MAKRARGHNDCNHTRARRFHPKRVSSELTAQAHDVATTRWSSTKIYGSAVGASHLPMDSATSPSRSSRRTSAKPSSPPSAFSSSGASSWRMPGVLSPAVRGVAVMDFVGSLLTFPSAASGCCKILWMSASAATVAPTGSNSRITGPHSWPATSLSPSPVKQSISSTSPASPKLRWPLLAPSSLSGNSCSEAPEAETVPSMSCPYKAKLTPPVADHEPAMIPTSWAELPDRSSVEVSSESESPSSSPARILERVSADQIASESMSSSPSKRMPPASCAERSPDRRPLCTLFVSASSRSKMSMTSAASSSRPSASLHGNSMPKRREAS
mmetsp:Transcript_88369/g.247204  ORF Transcript_88369/g.247204 Transcript_88369/m.247204 type:complete len:327 (-) Transcript_88369:531-1511(-)